MSELVSAASASAAAAAAPAEAKVTQHVPVDDATINYGALDKNLSAKNPAKKFYLTTAIAYTNGYPHMGHAYEFLSSDVVVRYFRVLGYDTYFLTGSDEHGQKVAAAAAKNDLSPKEHCDIYVNAFKALNQRLVVTNDAYQRTTDPKHEDTSRKLWEKCAAAGDIYLSTYEGWYNEREETFVPDNEAEMSQFKDPVSGLPLKRVSEESYFFKMSKYAAPLIAHIEANPDCIQPAQYRNEILARLRKDDLHDLSISRTTFDWGIAVPEGFKSSHVMYVWFDALTNYLSGVHYLDDAAPLAYYWPASMHVIGKDIIWFHCVIWPCMLMSAGVPLAKSVFSHGFVNGPDGRKMSKSLNNATDPGDMLDMYPIDSVRYYFTASVSYGADICYSAANLVTMHNSVLVDVLGNLVHRVLTLSEKYCEGVVPDVPHDTEFGMPFDLDALSHAVSDAMSTYAIHTALYVAMEAVRATNKWLTEAEPWKMKGEKEPRRRNIVRTALEAIYAFTHFLAPVIPQSAKCIFEEKLNAAPVEASRLRGDMYNLTPGTAVRCGAVLFNKIVTEEDAAEAAAGASGGSSSSAAAAAAPKGAKAAKGGGKKGPAEPAFVADMEQPLFSRIDLRVGRITKVWNHPTAERLFCEEIDVGDDAPRQIASGLREHYTLEQMEGRKVVVVCNLKDAKLQGFVSSGMVLAAKNAEAGRVELVSPPADAEVGERVTLDVSAEQAAAWPANATKKHKVWEAMSVELKTNADSVACWEGRPLLTKAGQCTVASNCNTQIS